MRAATLAVIVLLGSNAFGQEFPQPGPEHERLQDLVGEWDAVMKMAGQETKAKATYQSICGGMWIASDFEGDLGGIKFQGHGLDGYDQHAKKYVGLWVDSMSSAPLQMQGNYDAQQKQFVMTGESVSPEGEPQKFKAVTQWKDKDHFTFTMYMVQDDQEQPAFTIEYTRRK